MQEAEQLVGAIAAAADQQATKSGFRRQGGPASRLPVEGNN